MSVGTTCQWLFWVEKHKIENWRFLSILPFRLTDLAGNIHDGVGNYSVGVKCSWLIDAREHNFYGVTSQKKPSIRLHLEEFATECGWDHLYVFDGDSVESPLLAVFRWVLLSPLSYGLLLLLLFN